MRSTKTLLVQENLQAGLDERLATSALAPVACFEIDGKPELQRGKIVLQGAIAGESAGELSKFLKTIAHYPVTRWTIEMKDLVLLSLAGLRHLAHFAQMLHRRGETLEVRGIHGNLYATLQDLGLIQLFSWAD